MHSRGEPRTGTAPVEELALLGGRLCLDFANTVDPRHGGQRTEYLTGYPDLLRWAHYVGVLDEEQARQLAETAATNTVAATVAFEQAIALRETIYQVFSATARHEHPSSTDLGALHAAYTQALAHTWLVPVSRGFVLDWVGRDRTLDRVLWPVARSAVELLIGAELERVRECPGLGDCGWLFLDTSKNGSRRWCSMEGCGSRAKMRRQYARRRGTDHDPQ